MTIKILVVDDTDIILDIVEHMLKQHGHEVVCCSDGDEAVEMLKNNEFQMAIFDWNLPGRNGLELCRYVRESAHGGYMYIIMLTARDSSEEMIEAMQAGADDYVAKPFNYNELQMRVQAGCRILSLETRDTLVFTLAKLAESRDPDTGHHLERVQRYSRTLADALAKNGTFGTQVDMSFVRDIFLTSPLHDIGKVGVPDKILLKNGRLTAEEFEIMKVHTILGSETLKEACDRNPNASYLKMAYNIARSHHEKFNGKGYPDQLKGEQIPVSARIVAVADVYDALTSKRVYKDAMPHEVAKDIILNERGQHFDPRVVDAFLEREDQFIEISSVYRNTVDPINDTIHQLA